MVHVAVEEMLSTKHHMDQAGHSCYRHKVHAAILRVELAFLDLRAVEGIADWGAHC
jgi:hypothetical protein